MNLTAYLYVPFIAWVIAQFIKFVIEIVKGDADIRYLYASGGMPSAHSTVVCSLATYALINAGIASPIFGITAILAAIVMYDSFGVRRSAGEQAKTLNKLVTEMARDGNLRKPDEFGHLREILGHQPLEVLAGAMLGVFVAVIFSWQQLSDLWTNLQNPLAGWQITADFLMGAALIVLPIVVFLFAKKAIKKNKNYSKQFKVLLIGNVLAGLAIIFCAIVAGQQISPYNQLWVSLIFVAIWLIFVVILAGLFFSSRKNANFEIGGNDRKDKWLKKAGKKK